ncbi:MAG: ABC transporter permease, partial [Planctomycetota bacterium]
MSSLRLVLASLAYHWRMNLAVAGGVAAGTAVLVGALLVGDSMRGSLRDLTLDRLGPIDEVLLTERFFREELAREVNADTQFTEHFSAAVPAILLRASVRIAGQQSGPRANRVNLLGCDARFWALGPGPPRELSRKEIVLNRPLADKLGVAAGDDVILHLPDPGTVPGDSLLGKKRDTATSPRLSVAAVLPAERLGRFSLEPNQQLPLNAYVPLDGLQRRLDRPDRVNAILVAAKAGDGDRPSENLDVLRQRHELLEPLLRPTLADYGMQVTENEPDLPEPQRRQFRYLNVTSNRMLLEPEVEAAIHRALEGEEYQPVFTYLANAIDKEKRDAIVEEQDDDGTIIPYSTITAVDFATTNPLGPFLTPDGDPIEPLEANAQAIVLNSWAADDLGVEPGAKIHVTYFEPESTRGEAPERTETFELAAIADLAGPAKDKAFTPTVEGVTDKASIDEWEAPFFPFRRKLVRTKDDDYWQEHGLTPKAFVSLATGRQLWGSRFGHSTGFRVRQDDEMSVDSLSQKIQRELEPAKLGFAFQPVKRQGLEASV